jgi:hypothetical protein
MLCSKTMKVPAAAIAPLIAAAICCGTGGCSLFHHHQEKSTFKIIPVGDKNPSIKDAPYVETENPTTRVEVQSGPVGSQ